MATANARGPGRAPARLALLLLALVLVVAPPAAKAAALTVTTTADELNADGDCSLREAIEAANSDTAVDACGAGSGADTITVPAGGYTTGTDLSITGSVDVVGAGIGLTVITRSPPAHFFCTERLLFVGNGITVSLQDLSLVGGKAGDTFCTGDGGTLHNEATLTLLRVAVSGGTATRFGGGIDNAFSGTMTIIESTVTGHADVGGGAIFNFGTLTVTRSTVHDANAANGAGIYNKNQLTVDASTVTGNDATTEGGGLWNEFRLTVTNSTVSGNTASDGGGILNRNGGTLTVNDSTIAANTAASGAGLRANTNPSVSRTILADNIGPDCTGQINSGGYNLVEDTTGCTIVGTTTGNVIGQDPALGPLAANGGLTETHAPQPGSPAIDAGTNTGCPATDQRGIVRPQGGTCDIGAVETFPTPDPIVVTTTDDESNTDGDCSLREAIQAANSDLPMDDCGAGDGADNIALSAGTYALSVAGMGEDAAATGDLDVVESVSIAGMGAPVTVVDGGGVDRVFDIWGPSTVVVISAVTIRNGSISNDSGAAIRNRGVVTVGDSALRNNSAWQAGGGIQNYGTLTVERSTVSGNTAGGQGAGIGNSGTATVVNSTISGNTGASQGGGIFHLNVGGLTVTNSTVTGNSNYGIYNFGSSSVKNTIVANNGSSQCLNAVGSQGHNLSSDSSCGLTASGDLQNTDPLLGPLADNGGPTQTHAPASASPVIDAGSSDCPPPAVDQRGVTRPQGTDCDIGGYELGQTCYLDGSTLRVTLPTGGSAAVVRAGTAIVVTGAGACFGSPTVTNVDTIDVTGAAGAEELTIDLSQGAFAPGATAESGSTSEIEWSVDLGAGSDELVIVGSDGVDTIRLGSLGVNMNTDNDVDVTVAGLDLVTVNGGAGGDVVNGLGATGADPGRYPGVLHLNGEGGQDKLQGGLADDVLNGGLGADTLTSLKQADGADVYDGGAGTDSLSYASRLEGVSVTIDATANDGTPGEGDNALGIEVLFGGKGNDVLDGGEASVKNTIRGGAGDDDLFGGPNTDALIGEAGADDLFGEQGKDTLNAQDGVSGNDVLDGGTESDICKPDAGDTLISCEA